MGLGLWWSLNSVAVGPRIEEGGDRSLAASILFSLFGEVFICCSKLAGFLEDDPGSYISSLSLSPLIGSYFEEYGEVSLLDPGDGSSGFPFPVGKLRAELEVGLIPEPVEVSGPLRVNPKF